MTKKGLTGATRLKSALQNSISGCRACWTHEEAFRQEVVLFVIGVPLALYLGEAAIERVLLIGSLFLLMIVELLNSAIEAVVDRIGLEHHELSGRAKDIASAAVLFALIFVTFTWVTILL